VKSFHAEKWGPLGAIFASACCLGFSWLVGLVSAIGAGFIIRDSILLPLLIIFLAFTVWGLWRSFQRHHRPYALWIGVAGAILLLAGMFFSHPLAYPGIALLIAAPLVDLGLQMKREWAR
jgi:mercuric ion transport protein